VLTTRRSVPYNTGKVLIGLRYTPPPPVIQGDALTLQSALLSPDTKNPVRGIAAFINYFWRYM
jgi:hypothetical protein